MTQDGILDAKSKNSQKNWIFSYKLDLFRTFIYEKIRGSEFFPIRKSQMIQGSGKRGIRTLGTKKLYNGLAIRRFSPLSHLSTFHVPKRKVSVIWYRQEITVATPPFFLSKVYKNYIANSILVIFFFLNVNKKKKKILVFSFSKSILAERPSNGFSL